MNGQRALFPLAALALGTALILGGAGNDYPLLAGAIQLTSLSLLAALIVGQTADPSTGFGRMSLLLCAAPVVLVLCQLVPLPPAIWTQLPGRDLPAAILSASGIKPGWRPLSLEPELTIATALEMLPGIALFLAVRRLEANQLRRLAQLAIMVGIASAVIGGIQKALNGPAILSFFDTDPANAPGLFVNRDHQADFLLLQMPLVALAARLGRRDSGGASSQVTIGCAAIFLLAAGIVATLSRTGLLLLPMAAFGSLAVMFDLRWNMRRLLGTLAGLALIVIVAAQLPAVDLVVQRFGQEDARPVIWAQSMTALRTYWPAGAGVGTFSRVYPVEEGINTLLPAFVNNAHCDYIELVLDGGIAALLLIAAFAAWLCWAIVIAARSRGEREERSAMAASLIGIGVVLLHSCVDYPLRMMAIMALFGMFCGLLVRSVERLQRNHGTGRRQGPGGDEARFG